MITFLGLQTVCSRYSACIYPDAATTRQICVTLLWTDASTSLNWPNLCLKFGCLTTIGKPTGITHSTKSQYIEFINLGTIIWRSWIWLLKELGLFLLVRERWGKAFLRVRNGGCWRLESWYEEKEGKRRRAKKGGGRKPKRELKMKTN